MHSFFYLKKIQRPCEWNIVFSKTFHFQNKNIQTLQIFLKNFPKFQHSLINIQSASNKNQSLRKDSVLSKLVFLHNGQKKTQTQFWICSFFFELQKSLLRKKRILAWSEKFGFTCFFGPIFENSEKKYDDYFLKKKNYSLIQKNLKKELTFSKKKNQNENKEIYWTVLFEQKIKHICIDFFEEMLIFFLFLRNFSQNQTNNMFFRDAHPQQSTTNEAALSFFPTRRKTQQKFAPKILLTMCLGEENGITLFNTIQKKTKFMYCKQLLRMFKKILNSFMCIFLSTKSTLMFPDSFFGQKNDFVAFLKNTTQQKIFHKLKRFFSSNIEIQCFQNKSFLKDLFFQDIFQQFFLNFSKNCFQKLHSLSHYYLKNTFFPFHLFQMNKIFCFSHYCQPKFNLFQTQQILLKKNMQKQTLFVFSDFFFNFFYNNCSKIFFHSQKIIHFQKNKNIFLHFFLYIEKKEVFLKNDRLQNFYLFSNDFFSFFQNFRFSNELFEKKYKILNYDFFFLFFFQNFLFGNLNLLFFDHQYNFFFKHFWKNIYFFQDSFHLFVKSLFLNSQKFQSHVKKISLLFSIFSKKMHTKKTIFLNFQKNVCCFLNQINHKKLKNDFLQWKYRNMFLFSLCQSKQLKIFLKNQRIFSKQKSIFNFSFFLKEMNWCISQNSLCLSVFFENSEFKKNFSFFAFQFLSNILGFSLPNFFVCTTQKKKEVLQFVKSEEKQKKFKQNLLFEGFDLVASKKDLFPNILGFQIGDLFLFLTLKFEKNVKKVFFFKTKPTREAIQSHLKECKQILIYSISSKQFKIMKKLQKKICLWCNQYDNSLTTKKIFSYCDGILLKFLWTWAKRKHPNKSKNWIQKKYFHLTPQKKWFFGQKFGDQFVCLQLHLKNNQNSIFQFTF